MYYIFSFQGAHTDVFYRILEIKYLSSGSRRYRYERQNIPPKELYFQIPMPIANFLLQTIEQGRMLWENPSYVVNMYSFHWLRIKLNWLIARQNKAR